MTLRQKNKCVSPEKNTDSIRQLARPPLNRVKKRNFANFSPDDLQYLQRFSVDKYSKYIGGYELYVNMMYMYSIPYANKFGEYQIYAV